MNTELNDLAKTLRQIASGGRRSKIVRLREIFDLVEEAKSKGASNKEIVAGLKEHGLIFDVPNFKNARSRILKERALEALITSRSVVNESKSVFNKSKEASAQLTTHHQLSGAGKAKKAVDKEEAGKTSRDTVESELKKKTNTSKYNAD
jgi:hypothetical protein